MDNALKKTYETFETEANVSEQELAVKHLLLMLDKLEEIIEQENSSLESHDLPDFKAINTKKIRLLRDLEQAQMVIANDKISDKAIIDRLEQLQPKLLRNQSLLKLHLDAIADVMGLLKAKAQALETDGTYNMNDCLTSMDING